MNTKLVSEKTLTIIDQYLNFKVGNAVCSIPYYNNRHAGLRGALRVNVGKGSPKDIYEEVLAISVKDKIDIQSLDSTNFKKLLVDNDIGIDCSGLAYYLLNTESEGLGKGTLDKHIHFINAKNVLSKFKAKMNPEKSTDVATFADNKNSREIPLKESQPGDIITMLGDNHDHILIIHQIEYQNFVPITLHYTHSVAWPSDGEYGHGVKQGTIEILDINKPLIEQKWTENGKTGAENYTFSRAQKSTTNLRRMAFL
jgi:hypothetical protein